MTIDIGGLAQAIVNALISGLQNLLSPLPVAFLQWFGDQLNELWNGLWHSGANLLGTPTELTLNYPPAVVLGIGIGTLVPAITVLAVALLGMRTLWNSIAGKPDMLRADLTHNIFLGVFLAGASAIVLRQAYAIAGMATDAMGRFDYTPDFNPHDIANLNTDFLITALSLLLMLIFGFRLMLRGAYRLVLLLAMTPFAPAATIMWAIPSVRWIAHAYWVTLCGWLAGGVLAVAIVSLGVQIAVHETGGGGLLALFLPSALLMLAHDAMVWLPQWGSGRVDIAHPGIPHLPALAFAAPAAVAAGAAVAGAAGGATGMGGMGALGGGAVGSAALAPAALGAGYD